MLDFTEFKFRASSLDKLMIKSRNKSDDLSETTKTYLLELWIEAVYGRKKEIKSKYMDKGTLVEQDSLNLIQDVNGEFFIKNEHNFSNDWITGTPDVVEQDFILDIKSSWDLWTFASTNETKARSDYYYQMLAYMWLTGKKRAVLYYCLVNTPEHIIQSEAYRASFNNEALSTSDEEMKKFRLNYEFDDIEINKRVKKYEFFYNEIEVENLKNKIQAARDYLAKISL